MLDLPLCLMLVLISGNPAVTALGRETIYAASLIVLTVAWVWRGLPLKRRDLIILASFAGISTSHVAMLGSAVAAASASFLASLALAVLAVRSITNFQRQYVEVMVWAAGLSLVFWLPLQLGLDLPRILGVFRLHIPGSEVTHIGLHNFHLPEEYGRNSGFFTEPGMMAGYLVLAMLLAVIERLRMGVWRWLILVAAILSTQSTTGYIAMLSVAVVGLASANLETARRRTAQIMLVLAVLVAVSAVGFDSIPFLREKIEHQLDQALDRTEASQINRIGNLLYDLEHVSARPLLGWSPRTAARSALDGDVETLASVQGNGLSGFATKFGLLGLGLYLGASWIGFRARRGSTLVGALAIGVLATTLLGEQFLNAPLFLTTMFLGGGRGIGSGCSTALQSQVIPEGSVGPPTDAQRGLASSSP